MMVIVNVYIMLMGWNSAIRLVSGVEEAMLMGAENQMLELFWAGKPNPKPNPNPHLDRRKR